MDEVLGHVTIWDRGKYVAKVQAGFSNLNLPINFFSFLHYTIYTSEEYRGFTPHRHFTSSIRRGEVFKLFRSSDLSAETDSYAQGVEIINKWFPTSPQHSFKILPWQQRRMGGR